MQNMNKDARETRRAYHREWQRKNPDKAKRYTEKYWEKRGAEGFNSDDKTENERNDKREGASMGFLRIVEGCCEDDHRDEIVRVENIKKIFKGEGDGGTTIHFDVYEEVRGGREKGIRQYITEYGCTALRDRAFNHIIDALGAVDTTR